MVSFPQEKRLETNVEVGTLLAFYGGLLTKKQREALALHYDEDLSLGEIAQQFGVSRQSVHELITRSVEKLRGYEAALGTAGRMTEAWDGLLEALRLLNGVAVALPAPAKQSVEAAAGLIRDAISKQEEDAHGI